MTDLVDNVAVPPLWGIWCKPSADLKISGVREGWLEDFEGMIVFPDRDQANAAALHWRTDRRDTTVVAMNDEARRIDERKKLG